MSVTTSIRDYMEIINTQIGLGLNTGEHSGSIFSVVYETIPHLLTMFRDAAWYFVSFKGLRDNFYQPYLSSIDAFRFLPFTELQIKSNFENLSVSSLLNLTPLGLTSHNLFFTGLGNSFFISLPGSIGTLLILRRLITQGFYAGIAATTGSVLGSCSVMAFVIAGSPIMVLNPAFLDLFFYLGILIPASVILRGLCFSDFRIIPLKGGGLTARLSLLSIGLMHFLLGVSNQSTLFRHLRDLTVSPYPTRFVGISGSSNISGLLYILGFSIGSLIFAFGAFYSFSLGLNWWLSRSTITRSRLMKWSENASIVFLTCFSISTFSYYGADFLLLKGLGFLPSDKVVSETVLAPNSIFKDPHNLTGVHALYPSNEFSLDPAPFDRPLDKLFRRSVLLKQPGFKYRSFEELNYQGEKHWLHRGFRHGSAKPIKNVTLPAEKNRLAEGRALLRSLDKAIGWDSALEGEENQINGSQPEKTQGKKLSFTNLALEEIPFNFEKQTLRPLGNNSSSTGKSLSASSQSSEKQSVSFASNQDINKNQGVLEDKFKRLFFGQIGLLPGRLPSMTYGPFDSQEMAHKRLAFTNPVYKALLAFDIDLFLQRQPPAQSLSAEDEHNIYLKRQLLERYINTQRDYFQKTDLFKQILTSNNSVSSEYQEAMNNHSNSSLLGNTKSPKSFLSKEQPKTNAANTISLSTTFKNSEDKKGTNSDHWMAIDVWEPLLKHKEQFFTKSFANQTYKHQFKGTLEIIRQMFAVSLDCPEPSSVAGGGAWDKIFNVNQDTLNLSSTPNFFKDDQGLVIPRPINPRVLKFDQPLYARVKGNTRESDILKEILRKGKYEPLKTKKSFSPNQNFLENSKTSESLVALTHEELYNYLEKKSTTNALQLSSSVVSPELSRSKKQIQKPFLESVSISPFYVGWDSERRQLMLTQRYLSRKDALIFSPLGLSKSQIHASASDSLANDSMLGDRSRENTLGFSGTSPDGTHLSKDSGKGVTYNSADSLLKNTGSAPLTTFSTWPVLKADPTDKTTTNWRIPSRSFEQMVALEEEARLGLEEPSDKNKGLGGSIENFVSFWNKTYHSPEQVEGDFSQIKPSFHVSRWPTNITTPSVQTDVENFDQIENSLFTGVKRGGFIWPGSSIVAK